MFDLSFSFFFVQSSGSYVHSKSCPFNSSNGYRLTSAQLTIFEYPHISDTHIYILLSKVRHILLFYFELHQGIVLFIESAKPKKLGKGYSKLIIQYILTF